MGAESRTYGPPGGEAGAPTVPCWLCGRAIAIRKTQSGRPFLVCMDCGLQMFVRSSAGEERLRARWIQNAAGKSAAKGGESS